MRESFERGDLDRVGGDADARALLAKRPDKQLREVYIKADPDYTGRVTTPVLWDKETGTIVNNESRDIIRMFDGLKVAESFLLKTNVREFLFRKPNN